jgi:hypothetical protein
VRISRPDAKTVCLSELNSLISELLKRVPESADPGDNAAARARIFSPPTEDKREAEMLDDWQDYIEPELAHLFQSNRELIESDLQNLQIDPESGEGSLCFPFSHIDGWLNGLNQARLALSARYDLAEDEMEGIVMPTGDGRAFALLQVYVYAGELRRDGDSDDVTGTDDE